MKNKAKLYKILACTLIPLAIIIAFVGGYFSRYLFHSKTANNIIDIITLMEQVGYIYDAQTGEKIELTEEQIADAIVSGVLDRYSAYYTPEEFAKVNSEATGNLSGIGLSFYTNDCVIGKVVCNSPAELNGLKAGDKITAITVDGQKTAVNSLSDFSPIISAVKIDQSVTLEIERQGEKSDVTLVKSAYIASYVKYFDSDNSLNFRTVNGALTPTPTLGGMAELDDKTAYIILDEFNGGAGKQMEQALDFMKDSGRTKLILDLRDNGGGYTTVLSEIASLLIYNDGKNGSLIAFADGKKFDQSFYANANKFNTEITSIAVLANDNTASASECLIGAMLHYKDRFDESKLIIEKNADGVAKTYGKGIMQTTYGLISGGALKLTTAKMYLPDKTTSIHGVGFIANGENAVDSQNALSRAIEVLG